MDIFMTGASGFIGRRLLDRMQADSRIGRICCLAREPGSDIYKSYSKVTTLAGSLENAAGLKMPFKADKAVHLAGFWKKENRRLINGINVQGTANIVSFCKENGIPEIIFTSTVNVKMKHKGLYAKAKSEAESMIRASGLKSIIIRPAAVYGPGDSAFGMIASMIEKGRILPVFGNGGSMEQPIFVDELVDVLMLAVAGDMPYGCYEAGGLEQLRYDDMLSQVGKAVGKEKVRILHLPAGLFAAGAKMLSALHLPSPLTYEQVWHMAEGITINDSMMSLRNKYSLRKFRENLSGYLKHA